METNDGTMYGFLACTTQQFMTRDVKTVDRRVTMSQMAELFEKHDFNAFPVVENGKMLGIVSKFDFLRVFTFSSNQVVPHYSELMSRTVAEVMTKETIHVDPAAPLTRVLELMVSLKRRSFPVLDRNRRVSGIISREDIMRALKETALAR
jgi:CBS domain-containing protein